MGTMEFEDEIVDGDVSYTSCLVGRACSPVSLDIT